MPVSAFALKLWLDTVQVYQLFDAVEKVGQMVTRHSSPTAIPKSRDQGSEIQQSNGNILPPRLQRAHQTGRRSSTGARGPWTRRRSSTVEARPGRLVVQGHALTVAKGFLGKSPFPTNRTFVGFALLMVARFGV